MWEVKVKAIYNVVKVLEAVSGCWLGFWRKFNFMKGVTCLLNVSSQCRALKEK